MTVILVAEDEAFVRMSAVQMLEDEGFTVLETCNADEALDVLESRSDIDLLFTDIQMPGSLTGLQLAHVVRERWPSVHLVVTSGLKAPTQDEFPAMGRFLPKPYAPMQVMNAIQELHGLAPAPYLYFNEVTQNYNKMA